MKFLFKKSISPVGLDFRGVLLKNYSVKSFVVLYLLQYHVVWHKYENIKFLFKKSMFSSGLDCMGVLLKSITSKV